MRATFLSAEVLPTQDPSTQGSMRFKVSIQGLNRTAFYVLEAGAATNGVRVVEYRKADDAITLHHGICKVELKSGTSKSYELMDFTTIRQWLCWPHVVVSTNNEGVDSKPEIDSREGITEDIKSLLSTQIDQYPVGSLKRITLEAEMDRMNKGSFVDPTNSGEPDIQRNGREEK